MLTARIAGASLRQAELAGESAAAARQQVDSATLDRYLPLQSAVSTALGTVRAAKIISPSVKYDFQAPTFHAAVRAADVVGGSLPPMMQVAHALLGFCQNHRDGLLQASMLSAPNEAILNLYRESLKGDLESAETVLQAIYDALQPSIDSLRHSSGRPDLSFDHLGKARHN